MNQNDLLLSKLPLNQSGYIKKLNCSGNIRRRLLDLGFVEGACIIPVLTSPLYDLRAFFIHGTLIAIRKEDANNIIVCS